MINNGTGLPMTASIQSNKYLMIALKDYLSNYKKFKATIISVDVSQETFK
jgi:hypothetical protein